MRVVRRTWHRHLHNMKECCRDCWISRRCESSELTKCLLSIQHKAAVMGWTQHSSLFEYHHLIDYIILGIEIDHRRDIEILKVVIF